MCSAIRRNSALRGNGKSSAGVEWARNSCTMRSAIAVWVGSRASRKPMSTARRISSRSSGDTAITALLDAKPARPGRRYSVRSEAAPVKRMECTTPAGAHTAQCGGATHEPCSVHTLITPDTE